MNRFSALLCEHMLRGTGRASSQRKGPWRPIDLAELIGSSERAVRNWMKGRNLPEHRFVEAILREFFGDDQTAHADDRLAFRKAREEDQAEQDIGAAKFSYMIFGSGGYDPYSRHMPADTGDCYEKLFPRSEGNDQFEDLLSWLKFLHDNPDDPWTELLFTMQKKGRCIGIASLSYYKPLRWWNWNYLGVLEDSRASGEAEKLVRYVIDICENMHPTALAMVIEADRYNEDCIVKILTECESLTNSTTNGSVTLDHEQKLNAKAAKKLWLYSGRRLAGAQIAGTKGYKAAGALPVAVEDSGKLRFLEHVQPALGAADPDKEVQRWLMLYPLNKMALEVPEAIRTQMRYRLAPDDVNGLFEFLYSHLYRSGFDVHQGGLAFATGVDGYGVYAEALRQRMEPVYKSQTLYLAPAKGLISEAVVRLFVRYGHKLDLD